MSEVTPLFSGSIVALITPMNALGEVDYPLLKKLVDLHVKAGTNAIVIVGTTGEAATLTPDEEINVILKTLEFADGRIPIIAGTGANATSQAIAMTKRLSNTSVAGCLSVTPYYNKPTQDGMYQHFKAIAECTDLPQILYNVPSRTGSDLLPETVARLSEIKNIIGIKEATGDVERVRQIKNLTQDNFLVFSGDDATALNAMKMGAKGAISVTANVAPKLLAEMYHLALSGQWQDANQINQQLMPLHHALFIESNPIPVKWACYQLGLINDPTLRLPLTVLTESKQLEVRQALEQVGLL